MNNIEYEKAVTLYMSSIYKVALNACRNTADAEDIVQTTYEKLWKCNKTFTDFEHMKKWLIRVSINECNSLFRTPWMKKRAAESELEKLSFSTPEKSDLYYALDNLTQKEREILHLYYYEDYKVSEIADIMHMSESAIQTRLYRARMKLKTELEKEGWK